MTFSADPKFVKISVSSQIFFGYRDHEMDFGMDHGLFFFFFFHYRPGESKSNRNKIREWIRKKERTDYIDSIKGGKANYENS